MRILCEWLNEHTAEDIVRAHHAGTAVYVASKELSLDTCLSSLMTNGTDLLLIRECPNLWWLRMEDVLRIAHQDEENSEAQSEGGGNEGNGSTLPMASLKVQNCKLHPVPMMHPSQCIRTILQECSLRLPLAVVQGNNDENEDRRNYRDGGCLTNDDHVLGIVTAADLLHYLYLYGYHLSYLMTKPGQEISCLEPVETVPYSLPAECCLGRVLDNTTSGPPQTEAAIDYRVIGVVDGKGTLMTSVSLSNFLRCTLVESSPSAAPSLDLPIITFLRAQGAAWPPVRFNERHTFGETLKRILESPTHTLWRLDEHGRPRGLITLHHLVDYVRCQLPRQREG